MGTNDSPLHFKRRLKSTIAEEKQSVMTRSNQPGSIIGTVRLAPQDSRTVIIIGDPAALWSPGPMTAADIFAERAGARDRILSFFGRRPQYPSALTRFPGESRGRNNL